MSVVKTLNKGYAATNKGGTKQYFSDRNAAISYSKTGSKGGSLGTLKSTIKQAKALGIDTGEAESMVAQTEAQGTTPYKGSSYEKAYKAGGGGGKATPATVVSSKQGEQTYNQGMKEISAFDVSVGTPENPLTDAQVLELEKAGYREGDTVPGRGRLHPEGYFVQDKPQDTATYIKPDTEASITATGPGAMSPETQAKYGEQGYQFAEGTQQTEAPQDPEQARLQKESDDAEAEVNIYKMKLLNMAISDAELRADIKGITKAYDARIAEMREVTRRQQGYVQTLGYRMGMQFTGGMGGTWGGILSEVERQGIMKIADLEGQKQEKIIEAKNAARDHNFKLFGALMDDAREIQKQKATELAALKAEQREQDRKIAERNAKVSRQTAIADLYAQGITDPATILNFMNVDEAGNFIGDTSMEDVEAALKVLNPPDALKGLDADYQTFNYLKKIDDPSVRGLDWIDYQRIMANLKATASGANKETAEERKMNLLSSYASRLVKGAKLPDGQYIIGSDNRISPIAWNYAINDAQQRGLSRRDFIDEFGYLINPKQVLNPDWEQYNLSAEEYKGATGVEVAGEMKVEP